MEPVIEEAKREMDKAIQAFKKDLNSVSVGRATPNLLDAVRVENYGNLVPLNQVATISIPDSSTIAVQTWDKAMSPIIEKAILVANLGFTPKVDGGLIRINIPKLTEERRKELCKLIKKYGEDKKISIRNDRRKAIDEIKKKKADFSEDEVKKFNDKMQTITDDFIGKIDALLSEKEKDILKT
jgi:ribosome recycling factor